jgi:hypothetical protein
MYGKGSHVALAGSVGIEGEQEVDVDHDGRGLGHGQVHRTGRVTVLAGTHALATAVAGPGTTEKWGGLR